MRSLAIRIALRINEALDRKGRVWGDRHHRHTLTCPSEVRDALVYVLANHLKHGNTDVGLLDPLSSGRRFDGWLHAPPPPKEPRATQPASTWLLREGWHPCGFITLGEVPKALRA